MIRVDITNEQSLLDINEARLREAIGRVLAEEGFGDATISLAIVDDATIRPLNARYLGHDYATDVLSFVLEQTAETARRGDHRQRGNGPAVCRAIRLVRGR